MSEMIWTTFKVKFPAEWLGPDDKIPGNFEGLSDYLRESTPEVERDANGGAIATFAGEANYGLVADTVVHAINHCEEHRIPFHAWSDPKYEMDGEEYFFDAQPTSDGEFAIWSAQVGGEGQRLMNLDTYRGITDGLHRWASTVEEYFTAKQDLSVVAIDHLIGTNAPDHEEDDE